MDLTRDDRMALLSLNGPYRNLLFLSAFIPGVCGCSIEVEGRRFLRNTLRWRGSVRFVTPQMQQLDGLLKDLKVLAQRNYTEVILAAVQSGERVSVVW